MITVLGLKEEVGDLDCPPSCFVLTELHSKKKCIFFPTLGLVEDWHSKKKTKIQSKLQWRKQPQQQQTEIKQTVTLEIVKAAKETKGQSCTIHWTARELEQKTGHTQKQ